MSLLMSYFDVNRFASDTVLCTVLSKGIPPFGHHPGNIPSFKTRPSALISARNAVNISIIGAGRNPYAAEASVVDGMFRWVGIVCR